MATTVGTLGNDTLIGVKGEDNLIYGDALDPQGGQFQGGNDTIIGGANADNILVGDAHSMTGISSAGTTLS
jgi:hypothetical protein